MPIQKNIWEKNVHSERRCLKLGGSQVRELKKVS